MDSSVDIHIVNSALYRLGEKPITSTDELTTKGNLCRELYPDVRDSLLGWQTWPFATVRQQLARLAQTPPSDYRYYYMLPALPAVVRIIDIDGQWRPETYQREVYVNPADANDQIPVLATDVTSGVLRYVGVTSPGVWPGLFQAALAVYLAATLAPSITGKAEIRATLLQELGLDSAGRVQGGLLGKLRDIAGAEDSPRAMPLPTAYLDVRGGAGAHAPRWTGTA